MSKCKIIEFLFTVFPLKRWQDILIRRHMQTCPRCQGKLANRDETLDLMVREEHIADTEVLWAGFKSKLKDEKIEEKPVNSPQWKWAYGIVAAFVIVAGIALLSNISHWRNGRGGEILEDHFQMNYIRLEGKPAQAYLFKPHDTDMIIIWAQKNTTGE